MTTQNRKTISLYSALGLVVALAASAGLASAMSYDDEPSTKSAACGVIGCANGSRECARATGSVKAGIPPWVGEVSVSYLCYEMPAE